MRCGWLSVTDAAFLFSCLGSGLITGFVVRLAAVVLPTWGGRS